MKIIIPIIILLLSSCDSEKRLAKRCAKCPVKTEVITITKDSIWTKETVKYDTVFKSIHGPTVVIPGPCDKLCDVNGKLKPFYSESSKNGIKTTINTDTIKDELKIDCNVDSLMLVNKEKIIEINRLRQEISKTKETKLEYCQKQHKDWLDKYDRPWFFISLGAFLLWLGWKFKPSLLKLFKKLPL